MNCSFQASLWKHPGPGGWHFVTLPKPLSNRIRDQHGPDEAGWGRLKAVARIGRTEWDTSIWYDASRGEYLLPIKASVRKSEKLAIEDRITVDLSFPSADWRAGMAHLFAFDG
ncbi:MAG: DUF1905 domain-containing protein [Gemmatimonadota bacterium]|jgi:hypothetical protein|nr:DUF1905 domain-containing protein [Gemmatimonadota bacterium]